MSRSVGNRIREVLAIVEGGAVTTTQIRPLMNPPVAPANVGKYCSRAVGMQLLTVDRSKFPMEFQVVPDWRKRLEKAKKHAPKACKARPVGRMVNSVFALGAA